jgi:hypothetical protein
MREVADLAADVCRPAITDHRQYDRLDDRAITGIRRAAINSTVIVVASYFFAQRLSRGVVLGLSDFVRTLGAQSVTVVYCNPIGPSASWKPRNDMHFWYREFCRRMRHRASMSKASYTYSTRANLDSVVVRQGECAGEQWACSLS